MTVMKHFYLTAQLARKLMGWLPYWGSSITDRPITLVDLGYKGFVQKGKPFPIGGKYDSMFYHWLPFENLADAWDVHQAACNLPEPDRTTYYRVLSHIVQEKAGPTATLWAEALAHLTPADVCQAALFAIGINPQEVAAAEEGTPVVVLLGSQFTPCLTVAFVPADCETMALSSTAHVMEDLELPLGTRLLIRANFHDDSKNESFYRADATQVGPEGANVLHQGLPSSQWNPWLETGTLPES